MSVGWHQVIAEVCFFKPPKSLLFKFSLVHFIDLISLACDLWMLKNIVQFQPLVVQRCIFLNKIRSLILLSHFHPYLIGVRQTSINNTL